jgi:dienelactone hydrolase
MIVMINRRARLRYLRPIVSGVVALAALSSDAGAQARPELVSFRSGELELEGFMWKPDGAGPFPAVLWNHGSEKLPGSVDPVANFVVPRGYVFFVPHRRGQGRSPGPYIMDQLRTAGSEVQRSVMLVRLHEAQLEDQLAALAHLSAQPFVNRGRIAVIGFSFGGIQTMLAAERGPGYRVAVNCSGAAQVWRANSNMRDRLTAAARGSKIPVFFLQAQNDYDLTPNEVLAAEVKAAGRAVEAKVYPPHGSSTQDGHDFCVLGVATWGPDAPRFIEAHAR